ncbi:MAG: hypothetical protein ACRDZ3_18055, partial [Acidimicrobiia bacterium]
VVVHRATRNVDLSLGAVATSVVEGVAVGGRPVRLTPGGLEPVGVAAPDLAVLAAAGIEIVSAGETQTTPGPNQSDARATGPRIRFRTEDGRTLTLIFGEAVASSAFVPGGAPAQEPYSEASAG